MSNTPWKAFPKKQVLALIAGITGIPWIWDGDPEPNVSRVGGAMGKIGRINILAIKTNGVDDARMTYNAVNDALQEEDCGNRVVTLSLKVESYDDNQTSYDILELLRTRIRRSVYRDQLWALNLALVDVIPMANSGTIFDNRDVYVSTLDIKLAQGISDSTDMPEVGGYIQTVNGSQSPIIPGPFDPLNGSVLPIIYYDPTSVVLQGGKVSQALNLASVSNGLAAVQATAAAQPTLGTFPSGKLSLAFAGAQRLVANGISLAGNPKGPFTLMVAVQLTNFTAPVGVAYAFTFDTTAISGGTSPYVRAHYLYSSTAPADFSQSVVSDQGTSYGKQYLNPDLNPHVLTIMYDGSSVTLRLDGAVMLKSSSGTDTLTNWTQLTLGDISDRLAAVFSSHAYWVGNIGRVLMYNSALVDGTLTEAETFVRASF